MKNMPSINFNQSNRSLNPTHRSSSFSSTRGALSLSLSLDSYAFILQQMLRISHYWLQVVSQPNSIQHTISTWHRRFVHFNPSRKICTPQNSNKTRAGPAPFWTVSSSTFRFLRASERAKMRPSRRDPSRSRRSVNRCCWNSFSFFKLLLLVQCDLFGRHFFTVKLFLLGACIRRLRAIEKERAMPRWGLHD